MTSQSTKLRIREIQKLFDEHQRQMRRTAYQVVQDQDVAKDIVQEVFIKLWEKWEQIEVGPSIKYYLQKAVMHTAINHLNSRKRLVPMNQELDYGLESNEQSTDEQRQQYISRKIDEAIQDLPPKCRAIFVLCKKEGLRYKEIAEYLDISEKTVENQMGIALKKLREALPANLLQG